MIQDSSDSEIGPRLSLLALGAGSIAAQVVLLRELLGSFGGNEIAAGLALGLWILLTGIGSLLGGRTAAWSDSHRAYLPLGHLLLAVLPFVLLAGMRAWPLLTAVRGSQPAFASVLGGCLVLFLPYGLLSGAMIPWVGRSLGEGAGGIPRRAYALDSAGCAAGGAALSGLLLAGAPHGWSLVIAGLPHLAAATRRRPPVALLGVAVLIASALALDRPTLAWRYPGQEILQARNTPFGRLVVTRLGSQVNVFQDAVLLHASGDLSAEARVHPLLCQIPEGARVLLIGGSVFGAAREALRHRPARLDCVERDAALFDLATPRTGEARALPDSSLHSPLIRRIIGDGRTFLRRHRAEYDAILLDQPGPESAGLNRFYTEEFYREARAALRPGGLLGFALPSSPNYLGPEQLALERSIVAALRGSFPHVVVLPGESHLYLARDREIDLEIAPRLEARGIATVRLLDYDWPELSDPFRRDQLAEQLGLLAEEDSAAERDVGPCRSINRDLAPVAFRHLLHLRARIEGGGGWIAPLVVLAGGLFLAAARGRARLYSVGTSGAAAMGLEMSILLAFQVIFGNLYLWLAGFVTVFLLGAAIGAALSPRLGRSADLRVLSADAALVIAAAAVVLIAQAGATADEAALRALLGYVALPVLALLAAVPIGAQFAAAGEGVRGPTLARLYWVDLAGAAFGTILVGLIVLPNAGLAGVAVAIASLKLSSLVLQSWGWARGRRRPVT